MQYLSSLCQYPLFLLLPVSQLRTYGNGLFRAAAASMYREYLNDDDGRFGFSVCVCSIYVCSYLQLLLLVVVHMTCQLRQQQQQQQLFGNASNRNNCTFVQGILHQLLLYKEKVLLLLLLLLYLLYLGIQYCPVYKQTNQVIVQRRPTISIQLFFSSTVFESFRACSNYDCFFC